MADPALANTMDPANQPNPTPPAPGSPEHQSIYNGWLDYLSHPVVQTALLQFGTSMLQPAGWGQSPIGQVGQAVGEAGQAAGRYAKNEADAQQQAADIEAKKATTENEKKRTGIAAGQAAEDVRYHTLTAAEQAARDKEDARHQAAQEGLTAQQIASSAGSSAASTAVAQQQVDLARQEHADAVAAAAAALPGTQEKQQADIVEAQARAKLLIAQADAAARASKLNTTQTILRDQMLKELDPINFQIAHPGATQEDYLAAQADWARRIEAAGNNAATTAPAAGGTTTAPATTAPAAAAPATTTAPATTGSGPGGGSGAMDTIRANQKTEPPAPKSTVPAPPQGKVLTPLTQIDPALYAKMKAGGQITPEQEAAFIQQHTQAGEDVDAFLAKVATEQAKIKK